MHKKLSVGDNEDVSNNENIDIDNISFYTEQSDIDFRKNVIKHMIDMQTEISAGKATNSKEISLFDEIGEGAYGKVYKCKKNEYAIKVIQLDKLPDNSLEDCCEVIIMSKLNSIHITKLFDYWQDNKFIYLQMEYCDQDLKKLIEVKNELKTDNHLDFAINCEIFRQLLESVDYLHSRSPQIIHRDLKPSNVLIKYRNHHATLKLCDFGSSKLIEKESQTNTENIGTLRFRAPEISTNKYDYRVDIFSLGVIVEDLYRKSFEFMKETVVFSSDNSIRSKMDEVTKKNIAIKIEVISAITDRMLHGKPNRRPSCSDILHKFDSFTIRKNELEDISYQLPDIDQYQFVKFLNR